MSEADRNSNNDRYSESLKSSQESMYDDNMYKMNSDMNIKLFSTISRTDNLSTGILVLNATFCTNSVQGVSKKNAFKNNTKYNRKLKNLCLFVIMWSVFFYTPCTESLRLL